MTVFLTFCETIKNKCGIIFPHRAFCAVRKLSKQAGLRRGSKRLYPRLDSYLGSVWIERGAGDAKFTPWGTDGDKRGEGRVVKRIRVRPAMKAE
jgi:hypothetical protein